MRRNLAGAFVWSLEMDDFSGSCGEGKSPLISTVRDILKPYGSSRSKSEWGLKSSIAKIEVTTRRTERKKVHKRPTWQPKPSFKPRPTWKSKVSVSKKLEKPVFSVRPKPARKLKPTRKPRPTWGRPTSVPKIELKTTSIKERHTSRHEPTYRTITKQPSAGKKEWSLFYFLKKYVI